MKTSTEKCCEKSCYRIKVCQKLLMLPNPSNIPLSLLTAEFALDSAFLKVNSLKSIFKV